MSYELKFNTQNSKLIGVGTFQRELSRRDERSLPLENQMAPSVPQKLIYPLLRLVRWRGFRIFLLGA